MGRPVRRYVLTGAPGAGKSAILRLLERRGYPVVEEAATATIAADQALGEPEPWRDPSFIDRILALQQHRQVRAIEGDPQFHDRSVVCTLALCRYLGYPVPAALSAEVERVVAERVFVPEVFLVRTLGFVEPTAARRISLPEALEFERVHEQTYTQLGYRLVEVPPGPLLDRVDAVELASTRT
jgi:predicted ATPase